MPKKKKKTTKKAKSRKTKKAKTTGTRTSPASRPKTSVARAPSREDVDRLYDDLCNELPEPTTESVFQDVSKLPDGKHACRLMYVRGRNGKLKIFEETAMHWNVDLGQESTGVPCIGANQCQICKLIASGTLPEDLAREIKPNRRYRVNAVQRKGTVVTQDTFRVLRVPLTLKKRLREILVTLSSLPGDPLDPEHGRDVVITKTTKRKGSRQFPEYSADAVRTGSPIGIEVEPQQLDGYPITLPDNLDEIMEGLRDQMR